MGRIGRAGAATAMVVALAATVAGQWLDYPTAGCAAHGRWQAQHGRAHAAHIRRETGLQRDVGMGNARELRRALQRLPDFAGVHEHRRHGEGRPALSARRRRPGEASDGESGRGSQRPLHAAWRAKNLDRRLLQADPAAERPRRHHHRTQHAIPADLHRRPAPSERSESDLERLLDREMGGRHASRPDDRLPRRLVARCVRKPADERGQAHRENPPAEATGRSKSR